MRRVFVYETGAVILLGLLLFYRTSSLSELQRINEKNLYELSYHSGVDFLQRDPHQIKYIYLVQSGDGYNDFTNSMKSVNKTDVLVLTWDSSAKADITVSSAVSWSERRNTLYSAALHLEVKFNRKYEYYIFVDDLPTHVDLQPSTNKELPRHRGSPEAWRKFESYLNQYTPAIGVLGSDVGKIQKGDVLSVGIFEETVNAFHRDAVKNLLPYRAAATNGVDESWKSHAAAIFKAHILYNHYVLLFPSVVLHLMEPSPIVNRIVKAKLDWEQDIEPLFVNDLPENFHKNNRKINREPTPLNQKNGDASINRRDYSSICPL